MKSIITNLFIIVFTVIFNLGLLFAQGTEITILHVNDTHSHLDATGPKDVNLESTLGGISKAAAVIGMVRAAEPNVLLLHAGDFCVGDLFYNMYFGVPELQLMKQLDFDAMAVGNHEFDFGPEVLSGVLAEGFSGGSFPVVSANLNMSGYPVLENWITPYTIKNINGVKVGIFGMTIPDPMNNPSPVIVEEDLVPIAIQTIADLQNNGADVIIMLSHLGIMYDQLIASNVSGIDFIVGGHDHYVFQQPIVVTNPSNKPTRIVQAGSYYKYVGKLKFTFDNGNVNFNSYEILPVDSNIPAVPEIQAVVDNLKLGIVGQYGDVYHTVLGTAVNDLSKDENPSSSFKDTPLGNLITDAYRSKTNTQIGITANGLISERIYQGPIVGADVFRAASYGYDEATGLGFKLVTFDIRGSELLKGLEIGLSQIEFNEDYFLQVSGMKFDYNVNKPIGHRINMGSIRINDKPFIPVVSYSVTVNAGLYGLLMLLGVNVMNPYMTDYLEYDAIKDLIVELSNVNYASEGRIIDKSIKNGKYNIAKSNSSIKLYDNYPNPFNPATTIKYEIPSAGIVTIKVYNMLGQEVAQLVNALQKAGIYEITWDASNMPSGVYFYRINSNGFSETKKMILIK
jgi:2',3'-cyclic-nucleotide 2'-phosphodiesterase (5'-nucleotidase family)